MESYGDWLREARERLAERRSAGAPLLQGMPWMRSGDPLAQLAPELQRLWREGEVVWGYLVQANSELFHRGWIDYPALVIHLAPGDPDEDPRALFGLAQQLSDLRGGNAADPQQQAFGALLDDEQGRPAWAPVPESLAQGREIRASAVLLVRRWLPGTALAAQPLPLLAHPTRTGAVLPLPLDCWPDELRARWLEEAPPLPAEEDELHVGGLGFLFPLSLAGALVFLPALFDRIGLGVGQSVPLRARWVLTLLVPAIALGVVAWLHKRLRLAPERREVFEATQGFRLHLMSDDTLGLSLPLWAGVLVLVAGILRSVLPG